MSTAAVTVLPRKRRGVEFALILFALVITLSAYALVDFNVTGHLSANFPYLAGGCLLAVVLSGCAGMSGLRRNVILLSTRVLAGSRSKHRSTVSIQ